MEVAGSALLFAAPRAIVGGQLPGIGALYAASALAAFATFPIPLAWVGLLGIVALALGVRGLWRARLAAVPSESGPLPASARDALGVAALTVANGGDNLAAYIPWFATLPPVGVALAGVTFSVLTLAWCAAAHALVAHPAAGRPLRRLGPWIAPLALIAVGAFVLVHGASGLLRA